MGAMGNNRAKGKMNYKKIEVYFNGKQYFGRAAYINGWNGCEASKDHGLLCALIEDSVGVPSCWSNGEPNTLRDEYGMPIRIPSRAGNTTLLNGFVAISYDTIQSNGNKDFIELRLTHQNKNTEL